VQPQAGTGSASAAACCAASAPAFGWEESCLRRPGAGCAAEAAARAGEVARALRPQACARWHTCRRTGRLDVARRRARPPRAKVGTLYACTRLRPSGGRGPRSNAIIQVAGATTRPPPGHAGGRTV
jgi:hypothetical protein